MRGKSFGTVASPVVALGRGSGGGPTLIARRYYYATTTDTVPSGAYRATARCVGGGASGRSSDRSGGGGGAYARDDIPCAPGQSISISIPAPPTALQLPGGDTSVALNGKTVTGAGATGQAGGLASASLGTVTRSGGSGGAGGGGTGQTGASGWAGGVGAGVVGGGGGSAGDRGDVDALNIGGLGASSPDIAVGGPGYGGGGCYRNGATNYISPLSGVAAIEFWSA